MNDISNFDSFDNYVGILILALVGLSYLRLSGFFYKVILNLSNLYSPADTV